MLQKNIGDLMPKIYIDYDNTKANISLNDALSYLKNAVFTQPNIPNSFNKASLTRQTINNLSVVYNDLNKILNWLENSQSNYKNLEEEAIQSMKKIDIGKLKSFNSIVK